MSQSQSFLKLPTLDISKQPTQSCLSSLSEACREWGFFHISNHGISDELYSKLYSMSKQIFSMPCATKLKLGPSSSVKSYTPQFIASPFHESLRVSGPDFYASAECSGEVLFGQNSSEFSDMVQEYGQNMTELSKRIIQILLMSLGEGFNTKFYDTEFNKSSGYLRIINYTPPYPSETDVEGLGMHTDMTSLTILYPDDVSSLQVRSKDGKWFHISPCEGTLIVNIGDTLEAWSNGKLRSSEHRIVLRKQRHRLSLVFFFSFEDEKVIYAPGEVVGEGNVWVFKPFVNLDYVRFREFDDRERYEKVGNTVRDFAGIGI